LRRRWLSYTLALASIALLAWIVRGHLGELGRLGDVSPWAVVMIAILFGAGRGLGGWLAHIGLAGLGHPVRWTTCTMLTVLASYTNLVVPRAGLAPGAVYLRWRHGVPVSRYLSFAVVSLLVTAALVGAAGVVFQLVVGAASPEGPRPVLIALFAAASLVAWVGMVAPARVFERFPSRWRKPLAEAHTAWMDLARSPGTFTRIVLVQAVTIVLRGLRTWVALEAAGAEVSFSQAMLVSVFADLGMLISVTPSALGFREGGVLLGASLAGVGPGEALLAAVIDRLASTAVTVVAGQLVLWRGLRGVWGEALRSAEDPAGAPIAPRPPEVP
jgi:uncharacterized membrane protein YbhN (UPF0104 family)